MISLGRKTAFLPGEATVVSETIQLRQKGVITLPAQVREKYGLRPGDVFTLVDLGDGALVLLPKVSEVARLGDQVAEKLAEAGVSVDEVMQALDDERERYYQEHYVSQN